MTCPGDLVELSTLVLPDGEALLRWCVGAVVQGNRGSGSHIRTRTRRRPGDLSRVREDPAEVVEVEAFAGYSTLLI